MMSVKRIIGGKIVMPLGIMENAALILEDGKIAAIEERPSAAYRDGDINASGRWVLPGIIDCHSDAIEREIQPRPNSSLPFDMAFYELERRLAGCGITTIFHSISMFDESGENQLRTNGVIRRMVHDIRRIADSCGVIRHKIHLRFEINNIPAVPIVEQMLREGSIDELSFMDHTPGQGQFRDLEIQKRIYRDLYALSDGEVVRLLENRQQMAVLDADELQRLADLAYSCGIPLASHDDDSTKKLELVKDWHAGISEFPVDMDVAIKARQDGLHVAVGAPNVLLGRSHSNNLSALDSIKAGAADILCSDYYPPSLLHAVFYLQDLGYPVHEAVNMVSLNPAKALGIARCSGSIEVGKEADLILISKRGVRPVLEKVLVGGDVVYEIHCRKQDYYDGEEIRSGH